MSNSLLQRLVVMYGKPETGDVPAYLAEVARLLVKYSEPELERAGDIVMRTHRGRAFPTPSEIVTACEDARASTSAPKAPSNTFEEKYPEWSDRSFAIADRLVAGQMGIRAANDGWILGLHEYCRKHHALPSPMKVTDIQKGSAFVARCAAGGIDMGYFHGPLQKLAKAMVGRREQLARKVLEAAE